MKECCNISPELCKLLEEFECAFEEAFDVSQSIAAQIELCRGGNCDGFISDVARNCDYFSAAEILRFFFDYANK